MKISDGLKSHNMMEVEARQKLIEFGREKQMEAKKRLNETSEERDRIEAELLKIKDFALLLLQNCCGHM